MSRRSARSIIVSLLVAAAGASAAAAPPASHAGARAPLGAHAAGAGNALLDLAAGPYKTALFATRAGDRAKATRAVTALYRSLTTIRVRTAGRPPADLPEGWTEAVSAMIADAAAAHRAVVLGRLDVAHLALEPIRVRLMHLRERNGVYDWRDTLTAYHALLERTLRHAKQPATLRRLLPWLRDRYGRIIANTPPKLGRRAAKWRQEVDAVRRSLAALGRALATGQEKPAEAAARALLGPFAKLYRDFG